MPGEESLEALHDVIALTIPRFDPDSDWKSLVFWRLRLGPIMRKVGLWKRKKLLRGVWQYANWIKTIPILGFPSIRKA